MTKIRILAACFIGLNVLDAFLTRIAVGNGGTELNPLMRLLLEQPTQFLVIKIGLAVFFATMLVLVAKKRSNQVRRILTILVACMAGICLFNGIPLVLI